MFTPNCEQITEIIAAYGKWPEKDPVHGWPIDFRCATLDDYWLTPGLGVAFGVRSTVPVLIYATPPVRYRYVCDDPKPRTANPGDYIAAPGESRFAACEFIKAQNPTTCEYLIFRREEVQP